MLYFSKKSQYGLRAAVALAQHNSNDYVSTRTLSKELDISAQYLQKILHELTKHGITESCRGPHGGVRLKVSSEDVTIRQLIELLEGQDVTQVCPVGFSACNGRQDCLLGEDCPAAGIRSQTNVTLRKWAEKIPSEAL